MTKSIQKTQYTIGNFLFFTNCRLGCHPNSFYVAPFRWTLLSLRGCHRYLNPWGEQVRLSLSHSSSATRRSWLYIWLIYLGRVHRRHGALLKNPARAESQRAHTHTRTYTLLCCELILTDWDGFLFGY